MRFTDVALDLVVVVMIALGAVDTPAGLVQLKAYAVTALSPA